MIVNIPKPLSAIFRKPHALPVLLIVLAVITANSINLFVKSADPNPVLQRSGLTIVTKENKIPGYNTIDPNDGFVSQALGHSAAESWLHGHIPWWNYYEGIGAPLAGEMQSAAFFPLVLLLHFSNGLLYMHILLEITAGITTYLFLRRLRLSRAVAVTFGIAFALNGTFSWLANAVVNPVAFLPMLLLGLEIAYSSAEQKKKRGWALIAIAIALSLYSGFPETAYIDSLLAVSWGLVRLFQLDKSLRVSYIKKLLSGSIAGLFLAAPILAAFTDYLPYALTGGHAGAFAHASLSAIDLPPLFMPYIFGPIFAFNGFSTTQQLMLFWSNVGGYLEASAFVLAGAGLLAAKQSRAIRIMLGVFVVLCLGRIFGASTFLSIVNLIPGIKSTAFYRYAYPAVEFAVVILAAFGFDAIIKQKVSKRRILFSGIATVLILVALTVHARPELHTIVTAHSHHAWALASVVSALMAVIIIASVSLFGPGQKLLKTMVIATVVIIEALTLYAIPQLSTPKTLSFDRQPVSFLRQNLGVNRFYTLGPIEPNYGTYYKIASINQNDLPVPKSWSKYISTNLDNNVDPLIFTGNTRKDPNGTSSIQELFNHMSSYEDTGVKYLIVDKHGLDPAVASQHGLKLRYSNKILEIYQLPFTAAYFQTTDNACKITQVTLSQTSINCTEQSVLIRHELYMPGWSANVNGHNQKVSKYQNLYQSVDVPKGTSVVKFSYLPPHMYLATLMFVIGTAGLIYPFLKQPKPNGSHVAENNRLKSRLKKIKV